MKAKKSTNPRTRVTRPRSRVRREPAVLLPVLMQDPSVAGFPSRVASLIHPVVVKDPVGFFMEGPACRRVAIVDLDFHTGRFGSPVRFDPRGSAYRGYAAYRVAIPTREGARVMPWSRMNKKVALETLGSSHYRGSFLKVSVFGIVLRTIGLVQDPVALGREVAWAFPGEQLLVVPRAGALENAFYHRESRSLQFYYGAVADRPKRAVFSALSQDIVAHEATHAIIDGIAPDLYDASSSESLAIHEAVADFTAALLTMRNRESVPVKQRQSDQLVQELQESSRFSRIAEEFGQWRGHGEALRDVCNRKTLDPDEPDETCRVDASSPHSLSEVLSGLLFEVFRNEFGVMPTDAALYEAMWREKRRMSGFDDTRWRTTYAVNRMLSLIYKGLDWLPPGEASFEELIRAMIVADEVYLPKDKTARLMLVQGAIERHVLRAVPRPDPTLGISIENDRGLLKLLRSSGESRRQFVLRHGEALGIPPGVRVRVVTRRRDVYEPTLTPDQTKGESFSLTPVLTRRERLGRKKYVLVKLRWWSTEANDLGASWGHSRRFRAGMTLVFDPDGCLRAVLRAGAEPGQAERRSCFLKRLLLTDDVADARHVGPDGSSLPSAMRTRLRGGTLSVSGAFQALHVAADEP